MDKAALGQCRGVRNIEWCSVFDGREACTEQWWLCPLGKDSDSRRWLLRFFCCSVFCFIAAFLQGTLCMTETMHLCQVLFSLPTSSPSWEPFWGLWGCYWGRLRTERSLTWEVTQAVEGSISVVLRACTVFLAASRKRRALMSYLNDCLVRAESRGRGRGR
jgi:hypothetical protein